MASIFCASVMFHKLLICSGVALSVIIIIETLRSVETQSIWLVLVEYELEIEPRTSDLQFSSLITG